MAETSNTILVPNAGTILTKASSMWALYGTFVVDVGIKVLEYVQNNRELKWQDMLLPVALIVIAGLRVIAQKSVTNETERKLQQETIVRKQLEEVATTVGPPISPAEVHDMKQEAVHLTTPT
jgi:hypothetical protein